MSQSSHALKTAIFIVAISSLFYVYEFFLRVMPSVITHELQRDFNANLGAISLMTACFGYAYAAMQIPSGMLIDRYGPRILLTVAVLVCCLSSFVFMSTDSIEVASTSRLFIGAASACAFIAPLTLTSRWFSPKYFALVAGLVQMLGCLGAIIGQEPIALLSETVGWRQAMFYAACTGIGLGAVFILFIKDWPPGIKPKFCPTSKGEMNKLKQVIKNPQTWLIGFGGFACWAPVGALAEFFGPRFISTKINISIADSAILFILVWISIGIFSPLTGWWSDHIGSRKKPLLILGAVALIASVNLIYLPTDNFWIEGFWLMLIGIAASAQPIYFALVTDNNCESVMGTAIGFNNMAVASGAFLTQPIIGLLLDFFWSGSMDNGIREYSLIDFQYA